MELAPFDRRRYPTLPVRDGYREWAVDAEVAMRERARDVAQSAKPYA